jgi:hypothetical protein
VKKNDLGESVPEVTEPCPGSMLRGGGDAAAGAHERIPWAITGHLGRPRTEWSDRDPFEGRAGGLDVARAPQGCADIEAVNALYPSPAAQ